MQHTLNECGVCITVVCDLEQPVSSYKRSLNTREYRIVLVKASHNLVHRNLKSVFEVMLTLF